MQAPVHIDAFMGMTMPIPECGCWVWTGNLVGSLGYGGLRVGNKTPRAHRVSWELFRGPIPAGMHVLHKCDVPSCVNPDHLFLGTHLENMRDKERKGRGNQPTGVRNAKTTLSPDAILDIRLSTARPCYLARLYGVSWTTIQNIRLRRTWRHVA